MSFRNYYDTSSYGRNRDTGRSSSTSSVTTDRPTSVTAKYISTTPSYKSSSIPILSPERSNTKDESPISAIASRYANYGKNDKTTPKYEKKDYSKLTVPLVTTKSRDVSPVSTSSKYSYNRPSRRLSPERRTTKSYKEKSRDPSPADRDKDIPSKTDKTPGYSSLSSYKLYPRSSNYTRPASRAETKPEVSVNRYAIASRLSSNYLRSPPTVKRTSVSPVNHIEVPKNETTVKPVSPTIMVQDTNHLNHMGAVPEKNDKENKEGTDKENAINDDENALETVTVITRHTSPTPPGSSAYVRSRRAEMAKTTEKTITRLRKRPQMLDKDIQSDRLDDPTKTSRFGSTSRASTTNWTYYSPNSYTGYAGRYSTQYSMLRENASNNSYNDRSSRSHSREPQPREPNNLSPHSNNSSKSISTTNSTGNNQSSESNQEIVAVYEHNKDDDTSEIIINVNLKLKRAKSPLVAAAELVSPELTITNSQLPPQAPKTEGTTKIKKTKVRKSSTDSTSDSTSKKKVVKKRSKSVSSTDSDLTSETNEKQKETSISPPKSIQIKSSTSSVQNGHRKLKHSKSRESNSPESSVTLSTQSSVSEDDLISKSKIQDVSRTSADEVSIPTDRSGKQSSPAKNDGGTEEAKSFLIRALAPVTNLFKMRHQDSSDNSRWPENSTTESTGKDISNLITESDRSNKSKNIIASNEDNLVQLKAIRHIESGERAWWLDPESDKKSKTNSNENQNSDNNMCKKISRIGSGEKAWWMESNSENKNDNYTSSNHVESSDNSKSGKKFKTLDDEKPWWLDSSANIPEGIERLTPPRKTSSDSDKSEKFNFYKVRRIESGDNKDWWLTSNENSTQSTKPEIQTSSLSKSGSDQKNFPLRRIKHVESGERPWWLSSGNNIPEGIEKLPTPPPQDNSDSSGSEEVEVYVPQAAIPPFPLHLPDDEPLGDRRSPEGLETPKENEDYIGRTSPYENNRHYRRRNLAYPKNMDRYISRYTDIDDILGTSSQIYSPFMDSILARRTGQIPYDDDDECEEIDPTQVRIHDSTAQRPVIKKLRCRSEIVDYRDEDQMQIILYALPPNTTHILQPADVSVFAPLKAKWKKTVRKFLGKSENTNSSVTKTNFCALFAETLQDPNLALSIKNGFKRCGLYPLDPNAPDYTKCVLDTLVNINTGQTSLAKSINREDVAITKKVLKKIKTALLNKNINYKVIIKELNAFKKTLPVETNISDLIIDTESDCTNSTMQHVSADRLLMSNSGNVDVSKSQDVSSEIQTISHNLELGAVVEIGQPSMKINENCNSMSSLHLTGLDSCFLEVGSVVSLDDIVIMPLNVTDKTPESINISENLSLAKTADALPSLAVSTEKNNESTISLTVSEKVIEVNADLTPSNSGISTVVDFEKEAISSNMLAAPENLSHSKTTDDLISLPMVSFTPIPTEDVTQSEIAITSALEENLIQEPHDTLNSLKVPEKSSTQKKMENLSTFCNISDVHAQKNTEFIVKDPFELHLYLPIKIEKKNKTTTNRTPAAISSAAWREHYEMREKIKNMKQEQTRKRKLDRNEKQEQAKMLKESNFKPKSKSKVKKRRGNSEDMDYQPRNLSRVDKENRVAPTAALGKISCTECDDDLISDVDDDEEKNIGCDVCPRWYHLKCTVFQGQTYLDVKDKPYKCNHCE